MMKKTATLRGLAVVAAAATATVVLGTSVPAHADQVSGSCSSRGFSATVYMNYYNTGTHHQVTSYSWTINGEANSTQNNVLGRIRRVLTGGNQTLHAFARGDVRNGSDSHPVDVFAPYNYSLYAEMEFIFDVNNATDPRCTAVTTRYI